MKTALSIAGSDSSGGAGIQADLKTMTMNGVFAMTAVTALTAQNTTGVQGILEVPPAFLAQQLDAVFTDIRPDAVKIGMVSSPALIETIGERLRFYGARNIVLDPVFIFGFGMGVKGAALATITAQGVSAVWVVWFLRGKRTRLRLQRQYLRPSWRVLAPVLALGVSPFIMQSTESLINIAFNSSLKAYGGNPAVGAMTICSSIMQVFSLLSQGLSQGAQPIIGFNYGAMNFNRVKKALEISLIASEIVSVLAFLLFQFAPMSVISLFGSEDALYNEFAVKAFRIFLMLCPLTGFQTVIAVYLQAVGKPIKSAILSLARQIIFFVPAALLLPRTLGVEGVLWTGPVADGLAFIMSLALLLYEREHLKKSHALQSRTA